jgi:hypothetical protein
LGNYSFPWLLFLGFRFGGTFGVTAENVNTAITQGDSMVQKAAKTVFNMLYLILFMNPESTFELRKLHNHRHHRQ